MDCESVFVVGGGGGEKEEERLVNQLVRCWVMVGGRVGWPQAAMWRV